eukprot:2180498-Rhodomonas_salina.2
MSGTDVAHGAGCLRTCYANVRYSRSVHTRVLCHVWYSDIAYGVLQQRLRAQPQRQAEAAGKADEGKVIPAISYHAICARVGYARSGTGIAYGAICLRVGYVIAPYWQTVRCTCLRVHYAVPSPLIAYGAICLQMCPWQYQPLPMQCPTLYWHGSSRAISYESATRCPVLTQRMLLQNRGMTRAFSRSAYASRYKRLPAAVSPYALDMPCSCAYLLRKFSTDVWRTMLRAYCLSPALLKSVPCYNLVLTQCVPCCHLVLTRSVLLLPADADTKRTVLPPRADAKRTAVPGQGERKASVLHVRHGSSYVISGTEIGGVLRVSAAKQADARAGSTPRACYAPTRLRGIRY